MRLPGRRGGWYLYDLCDVETGNRPLRCPDLVERTRQLRTLGGLACMMWYSSSSIPLVDCDILD